jgi:hypothetical protein
MLKCYETFVFTTLEKLESVHSETRLITDAVTLVRGRKAFSCA